MAVDLQIFYPEYTQISKLFRNKGHGYVLSFYKYQTLFIKEFCYRYFIQVLELYLCDHFALFQLFFSITSLQLQKDNFLINIYNYLNIYNNLFHKH